jgi:hypothetical protein
MAMLAALGKRVPPTHLKNLNTANHCLTCGNSFVGSMAALRDSLQSAVDSTGRCNRLTKSFSGYCAVEAFHLMDSEQLIIFVGQLFADLKCSHNQRNNLPVL